MINRGHCITIVLLDTLSTKHDHRWIRTPWTYSCVWGTDAADIKVPVIDTYYISITLNWLVILLSLLNSTTLMFSYLFSLIFQKSTI